MEKKRQTWLLGKLSFFPKRHILIDFFLNLFDFYLVKMTHLCA